MIFSLSFTSLLIHEWIWMEEHFSSWTLRMTHPSEMRRRLKEDVHVRGLVLVVAVEVVQAVECFHRCYHRRYDYCCYYYFPSHLLVPPEHLMLHYRQLLSDRMHKHAQQVLGLYLDWQIFFLIPNLRLKNRY